LKTTLVWVPFPIVVIDFVFVFALTMEYGDTTRANKEQNAGDHRGCARRVPHRSANDSFARIKFEIPPYYGKKDPAAYGTRS
jgi:hypothetical protein